MQSIQVLCPVFSRKVFFRGDYYIGYANTFRYKHDVNNNSNTDHWCNKERERKKKRLRIRNFGRIELTTCWIKARCPNHDSRPRCLSKKNNITRCIYLHQVLFCYIKTRLHVSRFAYTYNKISIYESRFTHTYQDPLASSSSLINIDQLPHTRRIDNRVL